LAAGLRSTVFVVSILPAITYAMISDCHSNFFRAVYMIWAPGENSK